MMFLPLICEEVTKSRIIIVPSLLLVGQYLPVNAGVGGYGTGNMDPNKYIVMVLFPISYPSSMTFLLNYSLLLISSGSALNQKSHYGLSPAGFSLG